jgi:putative effector of murein hydrolase
MSDARNSPDLTTPGSSPPRPHRDVMAVLRGALAAGVTLALAASLAVVGYQLSEYDERRSHIPGHWIYRTLVIAPSLVQLAYVLPARRAALRRADLAIARGVLVGAVMAAVVNVAVTALILWLTSFD